MLKNARTAVAFAPWMVSILVAFSALPGQADTTEVPANNAPAPRAAHSAPVDPPVAPVVRGGTQSTTLEGGTQSTTLQGSTGSTMLQTGTQSTTLQGGTGSTMLRTGAGSTMLQTGTTGGLIQASIEHEAGPINILFLLDCSYSMKDKLNGEEKKMKAAKDVLEIALRRIPQDINVGLRVFGQGMTGVTDIDCRQTALLVPLGTHNRGSIMARVNALEPNGLTPIEYAIRQAAEDDFRGVQGPKTLILITDGADTCGGNPCEYIRTLPMRGIRLKVDVVGVDLKREPAARAQLHCIADQSGGKYSDANTAAEMIDSVTKSVDKAISGKVILKPGQGGANTETPPELMPLHATPDHL